MTQDEIQAVARALAKAERLDWDEVCPLEHDDNAECNSSTCIAAHDEDHDPEWARKVMLIKSQAAITALDAARGKAEPVAWLYTKSEASYVHKLRLKYSGAFYYGKGWAETPLYAHPPRGDQVARVVEWLRKENGLCDCHAHSETECGCGAWDDWKTKPLLEIADAIERGEPFNG